MFSKADLTLRKVLFDKSESVYYRIVRIRPNSNTIFFSSFNKEHLPLSLPEEYSIPTILKRLELKELILVDNDPCLKYETIDNLSEAQQRLMNRAWDKIEPLVKGSESALFTKDRYKAIQELSRLQPTASEPTIIKWLKNYFCWGMLKTALIADFKKCGAAGQKKSTRKISDALVDLIVIGFYKFFLNSEDGQATIEKARLDTIEHLWERPVHGEIHFDYGTFRRYAVKSFPNAFENKVYRYGRKNAMRTSRLRLGRTGDLVTGAGLLYQIDWTGLDVNLVAGFNRDIYLGKPILYCVVDSYSHLLVGILITFENPSWSTFMHALYNAAIDKIKFAARYGVPLVKGEWLGECLPEEITADNGEPGSIKANRLGEALGITLGNVESYRGDLKGICENMHKTIKSLINQNFVGSGLTNNKYSKRLGVDGRYEACLTLPELYEVAIKAAVLQNGLTLPKYPNNQDIISALVEKTPNAIWTWSRNEGDGIPDSCNETILFRELIEARELTPNVQGFEFYENQFFVPENKIDQELLENLINKPGGAGKQSIVYDKTYFRNKYWVYNERMIPLRKVGQEEQEYENIYEMIAVTNYYRTERKNNQTKEDLAKIKLSQDSKKLISKAKAAQGNAKVQFSETDIAKTFVNESEKATIFKDKVANVVTKEYESDNVESKSIDELDDEFLMTIHAEQLQAFDKKAKKIR